MTWGLITCGAAAVLSPRVGDAVARPDEALLEEARRFVSTQQTAKAGGTRRIEEEQFGNIKDLKKILGMRYAFCTVTLAC